MRVEGVNISSLMNKQMKGIGGKSSAVMRAVKILGRSRGLKGKKVGSTTATLIRGRARVGNVGPVFAFPYDEDEFNVYFYRTGGSSDDDVEKLNANLNRFVRGVEDANVWTLMLGKIVDGKFVEPEHDNSPDAEQEAA